MTRTRFLRSYMILGFLDLSNLAHFQCIVRGYIALLAHVHVFSGVLGVERYGSRIALFFYSCPVPLKDDEI